MGFFSNAFKAINNVAKTTITTTKTVGYAVTGAAVLGVLVVAEVALVPINEAKKTLETLPQIPTRILEFTGLVQGSSGVGGHIVGQARFQVITPSLIRLEYAEDNKFEDRPTMLAFNRSTEPPSYQVIDSEKEFTIKTSKVTLTYIKNSGSFNNKNLTITFNDGSQKIAANPTWLSSTYSHNPANWGIAGYLTNVSNDANNTPRTTGNLGGWYRTLDNQSDAVPLHDGLLSREGYYFIDDSKSAVITASDGYESRPFHTAKWKAGSLLQSALTLNTQPLAGDYQDGYFFAYGNDYKTALKDYRTLSGAVPLLPRKAFGVWYSKYYPYSDKDYRNTLFPAFRNEKVPLDVLAIDTDAKAPVAWNGWQWNTTLLPDPKSTLSWMHEQGVDVILNTHPSIASIDPKLAATLKITGADLLQGGASTYFFQWGTGLQNGSRQKLENITGVPLVFDFQKSSHIKAFMNLHADFEQDGVDSFWLDWCCDDSSVGGQINKGEFAGDNWINQQYAQRNFARGSRWLPLSRSGGSFQDWHGNQPAAWGSQRSTVHFTGDTLATWPMLNFQARFAAAEGSIGMSYVSNDIGGFQLNTLLGGNVNSYDQELYVRWIQLAAFQPILRLHSASTAGAERLPWEFDGQIRQVSAEFLRLRGALVPYLYTTAREAHDTGVPMIRAMYLDWPQQEEAYRYDRQYMLGSQLLVAPIGTPADKTTGLASKKVWFPPNNQWVDIFTHQVYQGGTELTLKVPLERLPVFAKAGAILPLAPYMDSSSQKPLDNLKLSVFTGQDGEYKLYEDEGAGHDYLQNKFSWTRFSFNNNQQQLQIGAAVGQFNHQLAERAYQIKVSNTTLPIMVMVSGVNLSPSATMPNENTPNWYYEAATKTLFIQTAKLNTKQAQVVEFR